MTRILLVAHAPLASALREVAMHVFPECAATMEVVDVQVSQDAAQIEALLRQRLESHSDEETLILVDAFGATPCNAAQRACDGLRAQVVAGVNVPMLWRALCYREEPLQALIERALAGAAQGVMRVPAGNADATVPQGLTCR
ncbi:MAG TPA: PTS fructose transporter subunit IIA [Rubrivivax sp.]|nr:PTS fructose transporter subunit IIA [Burkholderiales bacterium]HNU10456.1 PTS fructose transporter subunit IIA [Rubrivivax sp.]